MVVPARNLHRVPDWLDDHAAALSEPLACVCHCLLDPPKVAPGDRVVVTGPGPDRAARRPGGASAAAETCSSSACRRTASGSRPPGGSASTRRTCAEPGSADVVVECSGAAGGAPTCLEAARRGARYVQIGVFGKPVTVPLDNVFQKELVVTSGFASTPRSWRRAMTLIETRRVELEPLVSEVVPLDDWERVFADLRAGKGIKIVFDPRLG